MGVARTTCAPCVTTRACGAYPLSFAEQCRNSPARTRPIPAACRRGDAVRARHLHFAVSPLASARRAVAASRGRRRQPHWLLPGRSRSCRRQEVARASPRSASPRAVGTEALHHEPGHHVVGSWQAPPSGGLLRRRMRTTTSSCAEPIDQRAVYATRDERAGPGRRGDGLGPAKLRSSLVVVRERGVSVVATGSSPQHRRSIERVHRLVQQGGVAPAALAEVADRERAESRRALVT